LWLRADFGSGSDFDLRFGSGLGLQFHLGRVFVSGLSRTILAVTIGDPEHKTCIVKIFRCFWWTIKGDGTRMKAGGGENVRELGSFRTAITDKNRER
jgi:hypothetical protein